MTEKEELVRKEVYSDAMNKRIDLNGRFYAVSLESYSLLSLFFFTKDFNSHLQKKYVEKMRKRYGYRLVNINAPHDDEMYPSSGTLYLDPNSKLMFELPFQVSLSKEHIIGGMELEKKEFNLIAKAFRKAQKKDELPYKIVSWLENLPKPVTIILKIVMYIPIKILMLLFIIRLWYEGEDGEIV